MKRYWLLIVFVLFSCVETTNAPTQESDKICVEYEYKTEPNMIDSVQTMLKKGE